MRVYACVSVCVSVRVYAAAFAYGEAINAGFEELLSLLPLPVASFLPSAVCCVSVCLSPSLSVSHPPPCVPFLTTSAEKRAILNEHINSLQAKTKTEKPKPQGTRQSKAQTQPHRHTRAAHTHMQHTDNKKFLKRRNTKDFGHKLGRLVPSLACADAALIAFAYRCRLKVADGDGDGDGVGVLVAKSKYLPQRKKTAEKRLQVGSLFGPNVSCLSCCCGCCCCCCCSEFTILIS